MTEEIITQNTNDESKETVKFSDFNLSENLLKALNDMKFFVPSSIQAEAIPKVLTEQDLIAKAPTGSGKTATFAIPVIQKLNYNNKAIQALVLCPTRELAIQVHKEFEKLIKYTEEVSVVSLYGGQNIDKQFKALKKAPQIVVATPGRLLDHLRRGSVVLDNVKIAVLDEADEMLDMGFRDDIYAILDSTPESRQTVLFSATMAKNILELTEKIQKSPNIVDVTDDLMDTPNITQYYYEVAEKDKTELLIRLLNLFNLKLSLVFCNTKSSVDKLVEILKLKGYQADAIHGDMSQPQREKVMRAFHNGGIEVLVATDVAGRGIDVKNIGAVFNYDLPRDDEDYVHRIGRTARAGNSGSAFTFVSRREVNSLKRIERANGMKINKKALPSFEEIEKVQIGVFKNKIVDMIQEQDLSDYRLKLESMFDDQTTVLDIAAALLKISFSKYRKKINKNAIFEVPEDSNNNERRRRSKDKYKYSKSNDSNSSGYDRKKSKRKFTDDAQNPTKNEFKSFKKKSSKDKYSSNVNKNAKTKGNKRK